MIKKTRGRTYFSLHPERKNPELKYPEAAVAEAAVADGAEASLTADDKLWDNSSVSMNPCWAVRRLSVVEVRGMQSGERGCSFQAPTPLQLQA